MKNKVAVLPLSFGVRDDFNDDFNDDFINKKIANLSDKIAMKKRLPIIAEKVVAFHLKNKPILIIKGNSFGKGKYFDTYDVLSYAKKTNINKIVIVAHPAHKGRVYLTAKKLGYTIVEMYSIPEIYDKNSKQIQVRNKWLFGIHNFFAYISYYLLGKI